MRHRELLNNNFVVNISGESLESQADDTQLTTLRRRRRSPSGLSEVSIRSKRRKRMKLRCLASSVCLAFAANVKSRKEDTVDEAKFYEILAKAPRAPRKSDFHRRNLKRTKRNKLCTILMKHLTYFWRHI